MLDTFNSSHQYYFSLNFISILLVHEAIVYFANPGISTPRFPSGQNELLQNSFFQEHSGDTNLTSQASLSLLF